ncbi:MAG TPA: CarD family transcriptional regulator [Anaeromyxobacteraceae bacterium]|nr:CarD family transcriptional regulator [Anaeromyxobacteraceae bacterium]
MRGPPPRRPDEQREQLPAVEGVIADASELNPGDRVVYPNQGVCQVIGVEQKDIAGQKLELVRMRREEDGAAVLVPRNKVATIGLRRVATGSQMEGVFHYLAASFDDPELDWKVRHRDNADRLIAGGVLGVAEVVKGLHSLSRIRPLPTKEREMYDSARHLLVHEIAVSLGVPPVLAEDYVDFALMPPAGVKFALKPPPKPVLLPSRPRKRRLPTEEDDLGLGELGIDVDLAGALEGAAEGTAEGEHEEAVVGEEGAVEPTAAPDEEEPGAAVEPAAEVAPAETRRRAAAAPRKPAAGAHARKSAPKKTVPRKAAARKAPAKKAPARKGSKPAPRGGKKR